MICSVAFSMEDERSSLRSEMSHVQSLNLGVAPDLDNPVAFPWGPLSPETEALLDLQSMVAIPTSSPFPAIAQRLALLKPKHARAHWNRRALIRRQAERSMEKLASRGSDGCESALDQLILREIGRAQREGRKPNAYSGEIRDEVSLDLPCPPPDNMMHGFLRAWISFIVRANL